LSSPDTKIILYRIKRLLADEPDEVDGCQVSRACNDFISTACVRNMMSWGEPGTLSWTWAEIETAMGCVAKIWEEDDSVLSSD
jgi:hypothetical protein